jgi:hypothetical protein
MTIFAAESMPGALFKLRAYDHRRLVSLRSFRTRKMKVISCIKAGHGAGFFIRIARQGPHRFSTINASTATGLLPETITGLMSISLIAACSRPIVPTLTRTSAS